MPTLGRFEYLEALPSAMSSHQIRRRGTDQGLNGTLVLVHGFPLDATMWEPQLKVAEQGWRVIAPQLRGFGGTATAAAATTIDDFAGDVIDLLDGLHIERAVIAGLSMGGYITLAMFRHAPHYFSAMVLADTRAQADSPEAKEGRERMLAEVKERGSVAAADQMLPKLVADRTRANHPEIVNGLREMILGNSPEVVSGAILALMTRPDARSTLPTISCPTLILVGDEDAITPRALSEEMHQSISGAELVVIPGAGHMSNMEQPDAFNQALSRFLERRV